MVFQFVKVALLFSASFIPAAGTLLAEDSLQLKLEPVGSVRPGEFVTVPFVLKNLGSRPLQLAINQGDDGGLAATKTLQIGLTHPATGKTMRAHPSCFCPVGEGLDKRHFHQLMGGDQLTGEIRVYWKESLQIPHDIDRGDWRLQVQYVRDASMKPGQCDDLQAKQLWERTDVVSSNLVEIKLHVTDWDAPSTRALSRRIAMADVLAMRVASAAKLAGVFPQTKEALFDLERFPVGHHVDFRREAVGYMAYVPFDSAAPTLLKVLATPEFDGVYQVKYRAMYNFAAFDKDVAGPWLVTTFGRIHDDRKLQDKLLGAIVQCKYHTNDSSILSYMLDEVRSANPDRFASATSSYMIDACAALGVDNTRAVLEAIGHRLGEVKDEGRRSRLRQKLSDVMAN